MRQMICAQETGGIRVVFETDLETFFRKITRTPLVMESFYLADQTRLQIAISALNQRARNAAMM
jgi:hypothetical protein